MKLLYNITKSIVFYLCFFSFIVSCAHVGLKGINTDIKNLGSITEKGLGEISGIAMSRVNDNIFWVLNDSGNSASVYALNQDAKLAGVINIEGVSNNDWEDIASFEYEGKPYILIADTGDNFARRSKCFLHLVEEPDINTLKADTPLIVKPSWSITYTYEDGPRDCESVAVDTVNGKIMLLSKRDTPPVLYEIPLKKDKNAIAKRVTEIKPLPQGADEISSFMFSPNQVTAMDISADGLSAVVLTYGNAFLYRKNPSQEWSEVFSASPVEINIPSMRQAESICFSKSDSTIFVTTEQLPAPLYRIGLKK